MYKHIVLASDGSDSALRAAVAAADLARRYSAALTVVQVYSPPAGITPIIGAPLIEVDRQALDRLMEGTQDAVARRTGKALEEAAVSYTTRSEVGHPAECIVRVAEEEKADLIVLGSRGVSPMRHFFLGSVSERVAHLAHCPVLIVK